MHYEINSHRTSFSCRVLVARMCGAGSSPSGQGSNSKLRDGRTNQRDARVHSQGYRDGALLCWVENFGRKNNLYRQSSEQSRRRWISRWIESRPELQISRSICELPKKPDTRLTIVNSRNNLTVHSQFDEAFVSGQRSCL